MTAGYFQAAYFQTNYFQEDYFQDYGAPAPPVGGGRSVNRGRSTAHKIYQGGYILEFYGGAECLV